MREMLRIKRSVQATYNVQVNYMAAQMMAASMGEEPSTTQVRDNDRLISTTCFSLSLGQLETKTFDYSVLLRVVCNFFVTCLQKIRINLCQAAS